MKRETTSNMSRLEIINIHAQTAEEGKKILRGVTLTMNTGEIHAIMGPNGGGKSTLAQVLMGHPAYEVTEGKIILDDVDISELPPNERSQLGLFLGFQYPVEIPGVNFAKFLRQSVNANMPEGEKKLSPLKFNKLLKEEAKTLGFSDELAERALNQGFSGGEKKKAEVLQMAMLKPKYAVLDEPDSGLDVDALRYIAKSVNAMSHPMGLVLITHYQRILSHIKPDFVHVIKNGRIIKSGDATLAHEIETSGYEDLEG